MQSRSGESTVAPSGAPIAHGSGQPEGSPRGQRAIRRRLVQTAATLFVEQGYRATTTKQICERAQTTERTLFRHFTSKAGLFEATVVDPFSDFVERWLSSFGQLPSDRALDEQIYTFVEALVDFLHENRELLRLLMAAEFERDETLRSVSDKISGQFAEGLRILADEAGHDLMHVRHYNVPDAGVAMAAGVSMAMSMVLLERWVFVHDQHPPAREAIAREVSQMIIYGISSRPH